MHRPAVRCLFDTLAPWHSPESRKTIRTVVSLVLRVAVQHEVMANNPIRHLEPIGRGSRGPRALTTARRGIEDKNKLGRVRRVVERTLAPLPTLAMIVSNLRRLTQNGSETRSYSDQSRRG